MNEADFLEQLDITLGDSGDSTFSPEEKQRALDKAFNDDYVYETNWDSSLVFSTGTYRYALPAGIDTVQDVYYKTASSEDFPEPIAADCWEIVDGQLSLTQLANRYFDNGDTIYLKGKNKLTSADTISDAAMQEYILALAGYNTLTLLTYKKANLFLKNDTTMGELITLRRELEREVQRYRNRLRVEWEQS